MVGLFFLIVGLVAIFYPQIFDRFDDPDARKPPRWLGQFAKWQEYWPLPPREDAEARKKYRYKHARIWGSFPLAMGLAVVSWSIYFKWFRT